MQIDGWVIRLRNKDGSSSMEYKAPLNDDWTKWQEVGVSVGDVGNCIEILRKIGLNSGLLLDRKRSTCQWNGMEISLDDFAFLGKFVEIESNNPDVDMMVFNDFIQKYEINEDQEVGAYGVLMLEKLKENPSLAEEVEKYISSL